MTSQLFDRIVIVHAALLAVLLVAQAQGQFDIEIKITASDEAAGDKFGDAVAIAGDTAILGASGNDGTGSAYIFGRNHGGADTWGEVLNLTASDAAANDRFGAAVAIAGDTALVGASGNGGSGSAYIFGRNNSGADNWGQVRQLAADDAESNDRFGVSVAISGDIALVGALGNDDAGNLSGSAYIFERNHGGADEWGQVLKLTADDAAAFDRFGDSVAISGDIALVGAHFNDDDGDASGSAYIFERNQGGPDNWGQVLKLTAAAAEAFDRFGVSVAISGDTALVGANQTGTPMSGSGPGSAYIFGRNHGGPDNWGQLLKLTAADAEVGDLFGDSVAISGNTALVGAYQDDDAGAVSGSVYIFERNHGGPDNWGQLPKLIASDAAANDRFGDSVAISGNTALVGTPANDDADIEFDDTDSGSAYIFPSESVSPCDFNSDTACDATDIDLLRGAIGLGTNDSKFNVDGLGDPNVPDANDFDFYITDDSMLSTGLGDHDLNMIVNFSDFVKLSNDFGMSGTGWDQGNGNTDDVTNFSDFVRLSNNFGINFASAANVPEPAMLALLGLGGLLMSMRRRVGRLTPV